MPFPRLGIVGLSARLLLWTMAFVMVAEVLIYVPSIARFRRDWLEQRLANGHLALLAIDATETRDVGGMLTQRLLDHAEAYAIVVRLRNQRTVMLSQDLLPPVDAIVDLREAGTMTLMADALMTIVYGGDRVLRVLGVSPKDPTVSVEALLREDPLRRAMIAYSQRILGLSVVISLITAGLVYLSLQWMIVRPVQRLTASMTAFRADPEDSRAPIAPSARRDEIGIAERGLADMQAGLVAALRHKARLAALGEAVSKINHDLRNILSTARLVSDRLTASADPHVRKASPMLLDAIDRAVNLCTRTLDFVRDSAPALNRARFGLRGLVEDVVLGLAPVNPAARWTNQVDPALEVEADRDQLYRVIGNLTRNALEAGAGTIAFTAEPTGRGTAIGVRDDGPGLSAPARERLFMPFAGSGRRGSTGLGLPIAREIMRAHGGEIALVETGARGTLFRLELPHAAPASAAAPGEKRRETG